MTEADPVRVAIVGKVKCDALYQLVLREGSQLKASVALGIGYILFNDLLAFQRVPSERMMKDRGFSERLVQNTGLLPEDLWPENMRERVRARNQLIKLRSVKSLRRWNATFYLVKEIPLGLMLNTTSAIGQLTSGETPETLMMETDKKQVVNRALANLKPHERVVVEMRYGLNGHEESTLAQVGDYFGCSASRVNQISRKAMKTMAKHLNIRELED
jgi:RNA polymerase sigma factor (sigma-70 family)